MKNSHFLNKHEQKIISDKKICTIAANCQGAYIKALLEAHSDFSQDFKIFFFVNYQKEEIPIDLLKKTDILIYQPLSEKWASISETSLLTKIPPNVFKIKIPYLTFPLYWPLFVHDPRNVNNLEYPFGQFPYGDKYILDLLRKGIEKEKILNKIKTKDVLNMISPDDILQKYIKFQQDLDSRRDQKFLEFIIENFRNHKLFESYNHPSKFLAIYQVNDILKKLGYRSLKNEEVPINLDSFLQMFQQPINPFIAKALMLEFEADWDTEYKIWFKPLKASEYYRAYIYWDLTAIGSPHNNSSCKNPETYTKILETNQTNNIKNKTPEIFDLNIYRKNVVGKQIVFIHIPKTGGISIHKMLSKSLFGIDDYKHFNSTINLMQDPDRRLYPFVSGHFFFDAYKILSKDLIMFTFFRNPIDRTISAFEFMKAHPEVWLGKLAQETLKDFLSHEFVKKSLSNVQTKLLGVEIDFHYNYAQLVNKKINKEEYFDLINNAIYKEIAQHDLDRAKKNLEKLFFFGFTESLSNDIKKLFYKLGLNSPKVLHENRTPDEVRKRDKYTNEEIKLIEELNIYDIELYNYAKELYLGNMK